jgi:hypothetical protein
VKKLLTISAGTILFSPLAQAGWFDWFDRTRHHRMNAPEVAGVGFAAAAVIGLIGYLLLRRSSAKSN